MYGLIQKSTLVSDHPVLNLVCLLNLDFFAPFYALGTETQNYPFWLILYTYTGINYIMSAY